MARKLAIGVKFCWLNGGILASTAKPRSNLTARDLNRQAKSQKFWLNLLNLATKAAQI
ncbi:hypothetical protein [uncultured Campylobacter sp.]|uniref:hypothetical protein n=1 Tax=uncultured Campylobacter sp. TaxID=218934 RepID=UPI00321197B5